MSTVKVNTVDKRTGSTLTLGGCGTTVTLGAGATQSGFGRTGTVDWCTTAKTAPFTGVSGKGYFVNTTCGAITVTLPATPTAGDIMSIKDYKYTFGTNAVTMGNNGSNIGGAAGCVSVVYNTNGTSKTFVYVDSTQGWLVVNESTDTSKQEVAPNYISATGGTITTCGNYKIHTFTSDGSFAISTAPTPANNNVDYVVVAGGGSGSDYQFGSPGGGGAGGFRESHTAPVSGCYTASPLAVATPIPVSVTSYPITVGGGGTICSTNGSSSIFSTITSTGGGRGAATNTASPASPGGSGGGGDGEAYPAGGTGNTPPTTPPQGNTGGAGRAVGGDRGGGGGGGAGAVGGAGASPQLGGDGGIGVQTAIPGSATHYAGGGGGQGQASDAGTGGAGGGGNAAGGPGQAGNPGTANTGGGGGGGNGGGAGTGGSGVVIIRYRYQ